jgi:hypothetical protein
MTERGLPIADTATACPFVAFDDARDDRSDRPDPRHRCYAESPPTPRARAHQEAYCLSANFPVCPTFQDWARREAARVPPPPAGGIPADPLRDVPAQGGAGERPPALGSAAGAVGAAGAVPGTGVAAGGRPSGNGSAADAPVPVGTSADSSGLAESRPMPPPPWELPSRKPVQGTWAAPPPWSAGATGAAVAGSEPDGPLQEEEVGDAGFGEDDENAEFSRQAPPISAATGGALGATSAERAGPATTAGSKVSSAPSGSPSVGSVPVSASAASVRPRPDPDLDGAAAAALNVDDGAAPASGSAGSGRPRSTGLGRLLGWDRRPRAGAAGAARRTPIEPSWERPRRYEAYPTLRTRVGLPIPSRVVLAGGALIVAALILFFVPPLLLRQGGGGPGASQVPAASGAVPPSGSGAASSRPTAKPGPTAKTYTIRQGDTLSTIARRFKISVDEILAANKNIKNPNRITVGDVIVIPAPGATTVFDAGASASP